MSRDLYGTITKPKSLDSIDQAIFNGAPMPSDMIKYTYRKLFHLSAQEFEHEPVDQFYTNLLIYSKIQEKQRIESKHGPS
jgi:hypothetical protein